MRLEHVSQTQNRHEAQAKGQFGGRRVGAEGSPRPATETVGRLFSNSHSGAAAS